MADEQVYKVLFYNQGEVYQVFAKSVTQGNLFGFIEVEQILFGEQSTVVVDPSEEKLKTEFKGVKRFFIPMHSVVRIDEVEKQGVGRITPLSKGDGTVAPFPIYGSKDPAKN